MEQVLAAPQGLVCPRFDVTSSSPDNLAAVAALVVLQATDPPARRSDVNVKHS